MSYPFINLDKAKKNELIAHLKTYCGIEAKESESKEVLIEMILEFEALNEHLRPHELMPAAKRQNNQQINTSNRVSDDVHDYPKVRIKIQSSDKFDGQEDVLVWINGRSFQIQRDVEVTVPEPVYLLLLNAKTITYTQKKDGSVTQRAVPNYAIQFLGNA